MTRTHLRPSQPAIAAIFTLALLLICGPLASADPIPVTVERDGDRFYLTRGGQPYVVRGVSGFEFLDQAVEAGATTLRTWGIRNLDQGRLLDEAHARGLTVIVGLWLGHKRDGFDYDNPDMVQRQFEEKAKAILQYKDHPAILAWGIGNEAEAHGAEPWAAIQQLAEFVNEVDPHHPTVCVIAGASPVKLRKLKEHAPAIDILAVNVYRGYAPVAQRVRSVGWPGPYFVTEMGINGTWEADETEWGAELEPPSAVKAKIYRERYLALASDHERCIGIFPFKWGYVSKNTSTWFSLFHANGEANAVVDNLHYIWRDAWPEHRAPLVHSLTLNQMQPSDSVRLAPNETVVAKAVFELPTGGRPTAEWQIAPENEVKHIQGSVRLADALDNTAFEQRSPGVVVFDAPAIPGPYRVNFKVRTPVGKIGTANFPFLVEKR